MTPIEPFTPATARAKRHAESMHVRAVAEQWHNDQRKIDPTLPTFNAAAVGLQTFAQHHDDISKERSRKRGLARKSRRNRDAEHEHYLNEVLGPDERKMAIAAAYEALLPGNVKKARPAQRAIVKREMNKDYRKQAISAGRKPPKSNFDYLFGQGYEWPGGLVAGKYRQDAFRYIGLKSTDDVYLKRFAASMPRAKSGILMTGPAKDQARRQSRKIKALHEPYGFFCQDKCIDMFRIELDGGSCGDGDDLQKKIADLDLGFNVTMGVSIRDDDRPGEMINPHLYVMLPEGHAVWRYKQPEQYELLKRVMAAMTEALRPLGADPAGLAMPWHGKLPMSPHCDYVVINENLQTLSEMAAGLKLDKGPRAVSRQMQREDLSAIEFDSGQSNQFISAAGRATTMVARDLYRANPHVADDRAAFAKMIAAEAEGVIDTITEAADEKTRLALLKSLKTSARWAAVEFNPKALSATFHDPGAAAHLIKDGDDQKTRMIKGQAYSAQVKVRNSVLTLTQALVRMLRANGAAEPSKLVSDLMDATGLCRNTVKKHVFEAYTAATATIALEMSVQGPVKGSDLLPALPSPAVVRLAGRLIDIPRAWLPLISAADRRLINLRHSRDVGRGVISGDAPPATGKNTLDFLQAGSTRHFGRRRLCGAGVGRADAA